MTQYINKNKVVAEIDGRIASLEDIGSENYLHDNYQEQYAMLVTLKSLKFSINALEVKEEVNTTDAFIEKAEKWLNEHIIDYVYAKEWGQGVGVEGELFDDFKNYMKEE